MNPLPSMAAKLSRLSAERRMLVTERAAILFYDSGLGLTWAQADELALQQEGSAQKALPGLESGERALRESKTSVGSSE